MAPQPYFDDHGHVLPFDLLMQLEKIDDRTFRSVTQAFSPTDGETLGFGAFGGHVYAQAAWAAAQTIKEGFLIHVCFSLTYSGLTSMLTSMTWE